MDKVRLLEVMTDAYMARRRKGGAFDDTAAIQAYWECQPQMSVGQTQAFADTGKGNSVAGWKIVLRGRLAMRQEIRPQSVSGPPGFASRSPRQERRLPR